MTLPSDQNPLAKSLSALESLGLVRPANVLLTEYLAALTAEKLIDAATAARAAAAWHHFRYGTPEREFPGSDEAAASLAAAAKNFAAMPAAARQAVCQHVARRIRPAEEGDVTQAAPPRAQAPSGEPLDWRSLGNERAAAPSDEAGAFSPPAPSVSTAEVGKARREMRVRSLPLETATLIVVSLVVLGYVLRHGIDQSIGRRQEAPAAEGTRPVDREVWRHDGFWVANLRRRAQREAARTRDQPARLAYELLLSDAPQDAEALNDLAWLYLTAHDAAVHDSKRGLELALKALAISRAPQILDTAAEARYQTGDAQEAARLEAEAVDALPRFAGFEDKRFHELLHQQLEKFQKAAKAGRQALSGPAE